MIVHANAKLEIAINKRLSYLDAIIAVMKVT